MKKILYFWSLLLLVSYSYNASAQVSNDNEDEVYKIDARASKNDFVPGQLLVKFKDGSDIQIRSTAKGQFHEVSSNNIDQLLRNYGVTSMEKLFPAQEVKSNAKSGRAKAPNGSIVEEKNLDKVYWIRANIEGMDSTMQLIEQMKSFPEVEYAEPNYKVYITADVPVGYNTEGRGSQSAKSLKVSSSPETTASVICSNPSSNPLYFRQYGITQQNIHKLWNKPIINKKRPVIAILDTGVDITHPDLVDNIWTNTQEAEGETAYDDDGNSIVDDIHGWNFVEDYSDLTDRNGHGTHCAGIAAAVDNNLGIVGANPLALIMPVKVMDDRGQGDVGTIARGINYAVENGANVINMSFGSSGLSNTMKDALDNAYQAGAILVASAGNNGKNIYDMTTPPGTSYPAAYYLVLGVEASGSNLQRASYSNYDLDGPIFSEDGIDGRNYEIQVPGDKIYSTLPGGKYNQLSGTSMSAPLLAGAISALQMVKDYPSKDVLFGDLIHLKADFAAIYSDDTPRTPKIDLVSLESDDNVVGNTNIDGQVDVGETINFTPILRNTWADATDINMNLTVDPAYASFVEIENPEVSFGYSLSAYGSSAAQTPIRVTFANNIGDNTRIKFNLTISWAEGAESYNQDVYVTLNNKVKIGGLIKENRTLTADHVYHVTENIGIMEGVTLTVEPGTRLEFDGTTLYSFGKLVAKGTPEKPIFFVKPNKCGIISHQSEDVKESHEGRLFTNADNTLFTLKHTEQTPIQMGNMEYRIYYDNNTSDPSRTYNLSFYIDDYQADMTSKQNLLTDPNYLATAILQAKNDIGDYCSNYSQEWTEETPNLANVILQGPYWIIYNNPRDTIEYCIIDGAYDGMLQRGYPPYMKDCILKNGTAVIKDGGVRNVIANCHNISNSPYGTYTNITNCHPSQIMQYSSLSYCNYVNNDNDWIWIGYESSRPDIDKTTKPSYLGTGREDIVRQHFWNDNLFGDVDLSNMPVRPYSEAHGIVWKVVVNGKDAQDEYEDLDPLGVGKHKFEVYFNRPMNKLVAPQISFGVREPYTQNPVNEEGEEYGWNEDGTIYTAYKTINGRTQSDGVNRIYVHGAEDNEFFECPYEKTRFNINIQAAGSMATGFSAEAGMGKVELTWNNENNDFADAMGFNIYRFGEEYEKQVYNPHYDDEGNWQEYETIMVADTIRLNTEIVDIETTEYTDYDVTPGETYYYMYKVLSTDLQEYDVSNVVAATPLTSTRGDANGSGDVDVADIITTVNYAAGMDPKPFIFEAADMNTDKTIDILDVVGIIQGILNPSLLTASMAATAEATYTIENGTVYVESPVALAGVQVQLATGEGQEITVADGLNGFEHASAWLSDNDYLFMAYNMNGHTLSPGKHALLNIGDAEIATIRLSDVAGRNVQATGSQVTSIDRMGKDVMSVKGIYSISGQKITGSAKQMKKLPKGVYIIDGVKVVK